MSNDSHHKYLCSIQSGRVGSAAPRIETQIDMDEFKRLYFDEFRPITYIAKYFNRGVDAFNAMIKRQGFTRKRPYQDKSILQDLYCNKNLPACDIANMLKCDGVTIMTWVNKFGLKKTEDQKVACEKLKRDRIAETCMSRYGVKTNLISDEGKAALAKALSDPAVKKRIVDKTAQWRAIHPDEVAKSKIKAAKTCLEKYGVDHYSKTAEFKQRQSEISKNRTAEERAAISAKIINTHIDRYGGIGFQVDSFRRAGLNTYYNNHYGRDFEEGVDSTLTFDDPAVLKSAQDKLQDKYGVRYGFKCKEIGDKARAKGKSTIKYRYGYDNWITSKLSEEAAAILTNKAKLEEWLLSVDEDCRCPSILSNMLGVHITIFGYWYRKHNCSIPLTYLSSAIQRIVRKFLESLDLKFEENCRSVISPKEVDFYLPDFNLAIEVNGIGCHNSTEAMYNDAPTPKNYHQNKVIACRDRGIRLIHIYEFEVYDPFKWDHIKQLITDIVKPTKVIYARKCKIVQLSNSDSLQFLNDNHIQGHVNASVIYGLVFENDVVQVMSFGHSRFNDNYEWELIRLATRHGNTVIGGCSRLFKHFCDNHSPKSIISYCHIDKFSGNIYNSLGFQYLRTSSPSYWWVSKKSDKSVYSRFQTQKHRLKTLLMDEYDENATESDNMIKAGFVQVYDSGNDVYEWRNNNVSC